MTILYLENSQKSHTQQNSYIGMHTTVHNSCVQSLCSMFFSGMYIVLPKFGMFRNFRTGLTGRFKVIKIQLYSAHLCEQSKHITCMPFTMSTEMCTIQFNFDIDKTTCALFCKNSKHTKFIRVAGQP